MRKGRERERERQETDGRTDGRDSPKINFAAERGGEAGPFELEETDLTELSDGCEKSKEADFVLVFS